MTFDVAAEAYDRFMGRFSVPLAGVFADVLGVRPGERVLDVGCGPGALTGELVRRTGADRVAAVDPSAPFVAAVRERLPGVDVRTGTAEVLPFASATFDVVLAQLVVHFMADPVAGLAEMARVARPGGRVGACVWDHASERGPLALFWQAVHDLDPGAAGESTLAGVRGGDVGLLARAAGLADVEETSISVAVRLPTFDAWWEPFLLGVGPAGAYVGGLDDVGREALRARCAELVGGVPFDVAASAWVVRARAGAPGARAVSI